jgi:two-component system, NtrC family, response regulator HydG
MSTVDNSHLNRPETNHESASPTAATLGPNHGVNGPVESHSSTPKVLVVDDDPVVRRQLETLYAQSGYLAIMVSSAEAGIRRLEEQDIDFVITDIKLPGTSGAKLIADIHQKYPGLPVMAITGYPDIRTAVDVLKLGACDFVVKPFDLTTVLESTRAALAKAKGYMEIRHLRRWLKDHFQFSGMLSQTTDMHRVFEIILMAAQTDATVLIQGETGTGKELVANAIHFNSDRRGGPFVPINCAGFPESLLESELFGYEKGAFTGAHEAKQGKIAMAHRGTLFLDEIESMSLAMQGKMLRVLEDRKIRRLGGSQSMQVDMRVIAASNVSLENMLAVGAMRSDFYYRINVVPIKLIPLRERIIDIPLLVQNYLQNHPAAKRKNIVGVSNEVLERLMEYSWPGNIRELQNALECALLLAVSPIIDDVKLPEIPDVRDREKNEIVSSASLRQWLREKEKAYLSQKLEDLGGNVALTAKSCRIGVRTLTRKMRQHGLDKKLFKDQPTPGNCAPDRGSSKKDDAQWIQPVRSGLLLASFISEYLQCSLQIL